MDYYNIYKDVWNFHNKYIKQIEGGEDSDEMWAQIMSDCEEINSKYDNDFTRNLILGEIDEFERLAKRCRQAAKIMKCPI